MICELCKQQCEKWKVLDMFGQRFCLHDEAVDRHAKSSSYALVTPILEVTKAQPKNTTERKYIEKEERAGNAVVRGSDGIIRSVTTKQ